MKYILKTETNENGNLVFSKKRQGKDYIYLAKDENGNIKPVLKSWIIEHQTEIVNVRVSGDSIYAVERKKKIDDFGEKIGGAKKDLMGKKRISLEDLKGMSVQEKDKYLRKEKLWPKINVEEMLSQGYDKVMITYIEGLRNTLPSKPKYDSKDIDVINTSQIYFSYLIVGVANLVSQYKNYESIPEVQMKIVSFLFANGFMVKKYGQSCLTALGNLYLNKNLFRYLNMDENAVILQAIDKTGFMTAEEKVKVSMRIVSLEGFNFVGVENDGRLTFQKAVRNGSVTNYKNLHSKMSAIKPLLSSLSLECSAGAINDLLKKTVLYGVVHIGMNPNDIIGIFDSQAKCKYYINFTYAEFVENEKKNEMEAEEYAKQAAEVQSQNKDDSNDSNRKKRMTTSHLDEVKRKGPTTTNRDIVGQDFLDTFGIRGGEFGNWVNDAERQLNMNMCFDSFKDLAMVLGIPDKAVGLNHKLNIAFGARGNGTAYAHYEPAREVINLTKMKGAGSLAHEYFHAIDDMCGKALNKAELATEIVEIVNEVPAVIKNLVSTMKYKDVVVSSEGLHKEDLECYKQNLDKFKEDIEEMVPDSILTEEQIKEKNSIVDSLLVKAKEGTEFFTIDVSRVRAKYSINPMMKDLFRFIDQYSKRYRMTKGNQEYLANKLNHVSSSYTESLKMKAPIKRKDYTDFYKNAKSLGSSYSRTGHHYWDSNCELAARAFACYVKDKLATQGYMNDYLCGHAEDKSDDGTLTYPVGEERKAINKAFDALFAELRKSFFKC